MVEKIEQLKTALQNDTHNLENFLGHPVDPYTDLEIQLDDVLDQMPDDELERFFEQYDIM